MERLTDDTNYCKSWSDCEMPEGKCRFLESCYDRKIYNRLREYEDLEEQLEKVYCEHDGFLETVVKSLVKYNGEKPRKSRLLTDEDADKWEMYKDAEGQGKLIRLPCNVGDTVYRINSHAKAPIKTMRVSKVVFAKSYSGYSNIEIYAIDVEDSGQYAFYEREINKAVFLTKEEAEAALAEMGDAKC